MGRNENPQGMNVRWTFMFSLLGRLARFCLQKCLRKRRITRIPPGVPKHYRYTLCMATEQKIDRKDAFDSLIYFFAFTTPLFELPQLYSIYTAKSSAHVSLITWSYLAVSSMVWLAYGLRKKIKPLIASYILYSTVELAVAVSIIWFR